MGKEAAEIKSEHAETIASWYETYAPEIFARFRRWTRPDIQLAEDLTQITFLKALKNLSSFRNEGKNAARNWLFKIAGNSFKDNKRKDMRTPARYFSELVRKLNVTAGSGREMDIDDIFPNYQIPPTDRAVTSKETTREIVEVLNKLPKGQRSAFFLIDCLDKSYDEAAEMTGVIQGTVRSRLCKARAQLRADPAIQEIAADYGIRVENPQRILRPLDN